jgi:AcrR family transcriptional regulator
MPRTETPTRQRIVEAASRLFYGEGIGRVSVDAVAARAGVTKRTLYYHFKSKDELIAAYLDGRDQPNLAQMARWFEGADGDLGAKVAAIFSQLAEVARHPKWKGCGFLRTAAELAAMPGHPAVKIGARHKGNFEAWLAGVIAADNVPGAKELARQIVLLMDGAFAVMLIHRDAEYMEAAGRAARTLISFKRRKGSA